MLFLFSAFFSSSETALTSLSKIKIKKLSAANPQLSRSLINWLAHPQSLLTTLLIGNTFVNIAFSSLATVLAVSIWFDVRRDIVEGMTWVIVTSSLLFFAEVTPKVFALSKSERISILFLPILKQIERILSPLIRIILQFIRLFFRERLVGVPVGAGSQLSLEEIRYLLQEVQSAGSFSMESGDMMRRVIELHNVSVDRIMTKASKVVSISEKLLVENQKEQLIDLLLESGYTRVPVMRQETPVGYVVVQDVLQLLRQKMSVPLESFLRSSYVVSSKKPVLEILEDYRKTGEHMAFVMNDQQEFLGIVTQEDIMEEIVGEILDEYDLTEQQQNQKNLDMKARTS